MERYAGKHHKEPGHQPCDTVTERLYQEPWGFYSHSLGETNEDIKALIVTARAFTGPGILVPAANTALFRWCLNRGLRIVQTMTLMTIGLYHQPQGS